MKKLINYKLIEPNDGQVVGLPKNPRFIRDEKYQKLLNSVKEDAEFLEIRGLIVFPVGKKYVVIGGNQRLTACIEAGITEIPCEVLRKETPVKKLREWVIKDNDNYGEWDYGFIEVSDWVDVIKENEDTLSFELPEKMADHLENGFKEIAQKLNLDYTIFFDTKDECDLFFAFLVRLKNKFSNTTNVSKRVLQWIAEIYAENGELNESQLLLKMIKIEMEQEEVKPEKIDYKNVKI